MGVAVAAAAVAVVILASRAGGSKAPAAPPAFEPAQRTEPVVAYDVQRRDGDRLVVASGSGTDVQTAEIALSALTGVDVLEPATLADIRPGDWLTVVGIPNQARNLSIRLFVVIPAAGAPGSDGIARSAGGFIGHESSRDPAEHPVAWGRVTAVDASVATLDAPTGPLTVVLSPGAPLRRLRAGDPSDVHEGDRLVFRAKSDGSADLAAALVRSGGAR